MRQLEILMPKIAVNLTGQRFGRLLVGKRSNAKHTNITWHCKCDCGGASLATSCNLRAGTTKSCGCLRREFPKLQKTTHGHKPESGASTEYEIWMSMKKRCQNPKAQAYKNYGGRGIKVCRRWQKFENFLADMGTRPGGGVKH